MERPWQGEPRVMGLEYLHPSFCQAACLGTARLGLLGSGTSGANRIAPASWSFGARTSASLRHISYSKWGGQSPRPSTRVTLTFGQNT